MRDHSEPPFGFHVNSVNTPPQANVMSDLSSHEEFAQTDEFLCQQRFCQYVRYV
jgi:hypothetical protein